MHGTLVPVVALAGALVAGAAAACSADDRSPSGERALDVRVKQYIEDESRYRHTLDRRGRIESVRCDDGFDRRADVLHECEIRFSKVGAEHWSVARDRDGRLFVRAPGGIVN